ncbi:metallophosphoesterase [Sandaracinus amylolyticus]|uniref:metallophosphoesterase n=1 Tax=Sandaracinus amylolyticus TaxID=927083 RepID=UPI001F38AC32|nr:metallophosphoesterase [Sandaracinus amylolyticus]UJR81999.1 Purple acid phosphatase [Sandaracinus amylolyticus]
MRAVLPCSLVLVLCVACGDDDVAPPDAGQPVIDAGPPDAGPPPDDSPLKGPWTLRPDVDRIVVRWESRLAPEPVALEVHPEGSDEITTHEGTSRETIVQLSYGVGSAAIREPDHPGTYFVNEVEITGLTPATCYEYSIAGYPEEGGRFCTMHAPDDHTTPITFYAIGDTSPAVMGTVRLITSEDPAQAEFTVHVGDIQYYSTVIETHQAWFRLMRPLLRANAFLPCVGNHEVDEVPHEYDDYYLRLFSPAGRDGTNEWYHYQTGGVHFFSLSSEHDLDLGSTQIDWLEEELAEAEADPNYRFSIVYLHRPLYSVGDYRPRENQRASLLPIIDGHRIPLVLAGHMHGYERFEVGDVTYITTGAGGFVDANIDDLVDELPEDAALRVASGSFLQAMFVEIVQDGEGRDVIRGRVVDDVGVERDTFEHVVAP